MSNLMCYKVVTPLVGDDPNLQIFDISHTSAHLLLDDSNWPLFFLLIWKCFIDNGYRKRDKNNSMIHCMVEVIQRLEGRFFN
ncbi:hypothetical protein MTR_8g081550 [Medicago truncatula]|uniref:Uncharacterized protein n=1 Tax=Medicago truncatula TaxID=3880 RepID=G7LH22_MEDTR|nr:hypothetical protein MTR_8g081550 [Medicago truncatula]